MSTLAISIQDSTGASKVLDRMIFKKKIKDIQVRKAEVTMSLFADH
jgi:hypothetical protein